MSETNVIKNRVTFKKAHENGHIKAVLQELYWQVMGTDTKTAQKLELAITSLSKYPIHINSGQECFILHGFDKNLCKYVDDILKKVHNVATQTNPQNNKASCSEIETSEPSEKCDSDWRKQKTTIIHPNPLCKLPADSLFQAVLMKLYYHDINNPGIAISKSVLKKGIIIESPANSWYFVNELKKMKKYIKTEVIDDIEHYSLTEKGREVVKRMLAYDTNKLAETSATCKTNDRVPLVCAKVKPTQLINCPHNPHPPSVIDMPAGSYNIIMLVDKNEPELLRDQGNNQRSESRSLKVGDVMWVARSTFYNEELVLPYILERKRIDDLASSIKDGRFHEQKFRLRKCGIRNVIYLLENHEEKHCGLGISTLKQALANTRIQDGFMIHHTDSLKSTRTFLNMMTDRLAKEHEGLPLYGSSLPNAGQYLRTFESFNADSAKSKPLKCRDLFIKMLLQLKGVSVEKALAMTKVYSTPKTLMNVYDSFDDLRENELLLANLRFNSVSPRVGPAISKIIYMLFDSLTF